MHNEQLIVLKPDEGNGFDIGNTGANVAYILIPHKCVVERLQAWGNTAVANSFTISADSYDGSTQGAEDVGRIVVPDSASAFRPYYDVAGRGVSLKAGDRVLFQVDEAGDSGEECFVQLLVRLTPEVEGNQPRLIESA